MSTSPTIHASDLAEPTSGTITRLAGRLAWFLPTWAILLALGTITHQPDPRADFGAYARYVTTPWFLVSHLVASIGGAVLGTIGAIGVALLLLHRGAVGHAVTGLTAFVRATSWWRRCSASLPSSSPPSGVASSVGTWSSARAIDESVYGVPAILTGLTGVVLLAVGMTLLARQATSVLPAVRIWAWLLAAGTVASVAGGLRNPDPAAHRRTRGRRRSDWRGAGTGTGAERSDDRGLGLTVRQLRPRALPSYGTQRRVAGVSDRGARTPDRPAVRRSHRRCRMGRACPGVQGRRPSA